MDIKSQFDRFEKCFAFSSLLQYVIPAILTNTCIFLFTIDIYTVYCDDGSLGERGDECQRVGKTFISRFRHINSCLKKMGKCVELSREEVVQLHFLLHKMLGSMEPEE